MSQRTIPVLFSSLGVVLACGGSEPDEPAAHDAAGGASSGAASSSSSGNAPVMGAALTRRDSEPLVLTGAQLPGFVGVAPGDVVAFARAGDSWAPIPVQVDERVRLDFCQIYAAALLGAAAPCKTSATIEALFYADPNTYTGADTDPSLDGDDEVVLMARHAGARFAGTDVPAGVLPGSAREIEIHDGDETAYAYLFVRAPGSTLVPGADQDLVSYVQAFTGVPTGFDYRADYPFQGKGSCGYNPGAPAIACDPPILEDSRITTAAYDRHFVARWITDELHVKREGSDGADLLDVAQDRFAPNICGRTVSTFSTSEGAFVANLDGPVRAIRSYLGANSGPLTQRTHLFYEGMEVTQTMLRVHEIGAVMDLEDYATSATDMVYYNSENPSGAPIDGTLDAISSAVPSWELVSGPHGSVMHVLRMRSSMELSKVAYYLDDSHADSTGNDQCEVSNVLHSPDTVAWGQSGLQVNTTIPDTDPRDGSKEHVFFERTSYYEKPSFGVADAAARAALGALSVQVRQLGGADSCGDGTCSAAEAETCAFDCTPSRGECGDATCDPWENSVSCASDCSTGGPSDDKCGNGTCDAGEHELNCAADCWTDAYDQLATCTRSKCAMADGACGDEPACVSYFVCVAECVHAGGSAETCEGTCDGQVTTTQEQHDYADALLTCTIAKKCAASL